MSVFPGPERPAHLAFTVDTHLLRELGALLVGRDSTALIELLKNAYDADATSVVVHGQELANKGSITVSDDGHGMTYSEFQEKFLRIAGRSKEGPGRRSPRFGRAYTGAKGIGRLSSHKLASVLAIESRPEQSAEQGDLPRMGVNALIDWDTIEESMQSMDEAREILASAEVSAGVPGTLLELRNLHSAWSARQLNEFLSEVRSTRADSAIVLTPPKDLFPSATLLGEIDVADSNEHDPGFRIELSGDFQGTEPQWPTLLSHVNWMIEIDASSLSEVTYRISPSARTLVTYPEAEVRNFVVDRDSDGPRFVARLLVRDGSDPKDSKLPDALSRFAREAAGVRFYYEGFRVLPYGSSRNDWLGLDQATVRREALSVSEQILAREVRSKSDERTYQLSNSSYFGGVFVHDRGSGGLQMVINREGFLPSQPFEDLVRIVKRGIDLSVRVRAALGASSKERLAAEEAKRRRAEINELLEDRAIPSKSSSSEERREAWIEAGKAAAVELRQNLPSSPESQRSIAIVSAALDQLHSHTDEGLDERAQLRVLASLGTQVAAFVHEVNGVLGQARVVRELLEKLLNELPEHAPRIRSISRAQTEVIATLERQAIYLSDSIGAEARQRRVRQRVSERLATALRLLHGAASQRSVDIIDALPDGLRTPPMFAAEMNVIFVNLVSNAIKAAAASQLNATNGRGQVQVRGRSEAGQLVIIVENSGVAVEPANGDRWFGAFETTTSEVDALLGQGLGLGLTLTRRIIEEYGGRIRFIEPQLGMSTALQVSIPER
jgi:signal transduction histidine kinase